MDCGFCIVCVPSFTLQHAFNVRSSKGRRVCTVEIGENVPDQFPSWPFFSLHSSLSTSTEPVRPAAKCGERSPGMGLSNVASGRRSPFYLTVGFSFLGFLSRPPRSTRCRFSRVFRISTTARRLSSNTHIFHVISFPSRAS